MECFLGNESLFIVTSNDFLFIKTNDMNLILLFIMNLFRIGLPTGANIYAAYEVSKYLKHILWGTEIWIVYLITSFMFFVLSILNSSNLINFQRPEVRRMLQFIEDKYIFTLFNILVLVYYLYFHTDLIVLENNMAQNVAILVFAALIHFLLEIMIRIFVDVVFKR